MKRKRGSRDIRTVTKDAAGRVIDVRTGRVVKCRTDWERIRNMPDSEIRFTEDAPRTSPEDWVNAVLHKGWDVPFRKKQIALRIDEDVLEWFKAQGPGYQTRINAVLREFRNAHR